MTSKRTTTTPCCKTNCNYEKIHNNDIKFCQALDKLHQSIKSKLKVECACNFLFNIIFTTNKLITYNNNTFNFFVWSNKNPKIQKKILMGLNKTSPTINKQQLRIPHGCIHLITSPLDENSPSGLYTNILQNCNFKLHSECVHVWVQYTTQMRSSDECGEHLQRCVKCERIVRL
jgi:hypothetical protein